MTCEVRIQPTAQKELESIVAYLSSLGLGAARSFLGEWETAIEGLRDGVVEHRLSRFETLARLGYRTIIVGSYIILYFKEGDVAIVAHLFHQSQDYANIVLNGL